MRQESAPLPRPFILRRLHSLLGVWLVIYLFEHLLVNSQVALWAEDGGYGFVSMVNKIHSLPYLPVIEIVFLGLPFALHGIIGIFYLRSAKSNARKTDGTSPALPQYKRNRAFTWQRLTAWLLIVGILAHVVHMRFMESPTLVYDGPDRYYVTTLKEDPKLLRAAERLEVPVRSSSVPGKIEVIAPNAGTAFLLVVRQAFQNPLLVILYSILVVAASYHGFNGLWTFMISWGVTLSQRSQRNMRRVTTALMVLVSFLGLMAAWGTYWSTL